MRLPLAILGLLTACGTAGCSGTSQSPAAQSRITTGSVSLERAAATQDERPGYHGRGRYVLTADERAYDCKQIAFMVTKRVQAIDAMPDQAKAQKDGPPPSMLRAVQRLSGHGIPAYEDYKREHGHLKALAQLANDKACPAVDVDALTKGASDKLAILRDRKS